MAIVLNFNFLCGEAIDINNALYNIADINWDLSIEKIFCIDNWMWEKQEELRDMTFIYEKLQEEKIVIIKLKVKNTKDAGMYVEKIGENYAYDLWINTEGYPELDADIINEKNELFFQCVYKKFDKLLKKQDISFLVLGIGLETNFGYGCNVFEIIKKSENVIVWIVNKNLDTCKKIDGYEKKNMDKVGFCVFERRKGEDKRTVNVYPLQE